MNKVQELEQHLWNKKKELVDTVEAEGGEVKYPESDIASKLRDIFPMTHGSTDKTHQVWSRVLRDLVWLGWLSEAKRRDGRYDDRICDALTASITKAFQIGRNYAEERK